MAKFTKKSENQHSVTIYSFQVRRPIRYTCCVNLKLIGVTAFAIAKKKFTEGRTDRRTKLVTIYWGINTDNLTRKTI